MANAAPDMFLPSSEQRRVMVDRQVRTFDVTDHAVTTRLLEVPREMFVGDAQRALAYSDSPIDLAERDGSRSRVMLPPFVIARMMQASAPQPSDRVLDIAGGTGYSAALFAGLVSEVIAVESDPVLSARASRNFASLGLSNARAIEAPLRSGGAGLDPFDIIFINGCIDAYFGDFAALLSAQGRMFAIVPKPSGSTMVAQITGTGSELSTRPLFDAQAPFIDELRREPSFAL